MGPPRQSWLQAVAVVALAAAVGPLVARAKGPTPEEARSFWAFQPVKRPDVPQVKQKDWVRNPIDAFVLAKLEEKGFTPAPPATKVQLLRRA